MSPSQRRERRPRRRREPRSAIEPLHPVADPPEVESFREWDLGEPIQDTIEAMGIHTPTPIQALAIGPVLEGRDVIAKAETGTGKTLAFGAPIMARIDPVRSTVLALVLCPTRELSEQVHAVMAELGRARGIKTALIVGGEEMAPQVKALQEGAQVVVATPGRVLDLMNQRFLAFPWTEYVVLDEADKMLEIGFLDDVRAILAACNEERNTLLFSATFPPPLLKLAREETTDPVEVATASGMATVDTITQYWLPVTEDGRAEALATLIDSSGPDDVFLIFCDRRTDVDRLLRRLERERFSVKALHGGYDQASRFRVMSAFRTGEVKALVATDVASRGLDVEHVTHVVNYGVPRDANDYTHRIGRTGRAGRAGTSITLVGPSNRRNWQNLLRSVPFVIVELGSPRELAHPDREGRGGRRRSARPPREREERPRRGRGEGARRDERGEEAPRQDERRDEAPRRGGRRGDGRPARREPADSPAPAAAPEAAASPPGDFGAGIAEGAGARRSGAGAREGRGRGGRRRGGRDDERPTDERPTEERPAAERPTAERPTAERPTAERPTDERPTAERPTDERPAAEARPEPDERPEPGGFGTGL